MAGPSAFRTSEVSRHGNVSASHLTSPSNRSACGPQLETWPPSRFHAAWESWGKINHHVRVNRYEKSSRLLRRFCLHDHNARHSRFRERRRFAPRLRDHAHRSSRERTAVRNERRRDRHIRPVHQTALRRECTGGEARCPQHSQSKEPDEGRDARHLALWRGREQRGLP